MSGADAVPLDPLIHAPVRLRIMVTLSKLGVNDTLSFPRLQDLLSVTAGNLVTHLRKLESGGYVDMGKSVDGTKIALSLQGRAALETYTATLQRLLDDVPRLP